MIFAFCGVAILTPFAVSFALILSMESEHRNRQKQIHCIAKDFEVYLDEVTRENEELAKRYGFTLSDMRADHSRECSSNDDDMVSTKR